MKKYLYPLLCMAVAILSAASFVSCGDDDDPAPEPTPEIHNYAKYVGMFSEEIFDYYNISVTFEYDDQSVTYKFDDKTKVKALDRSKIPGMPEDANPAGRVLDVPAFEFAIHPVKCTHNFELTEAGKQKIANATTEEIFVGFNINFGESGTGMLGDGTIDADAFAGVYVPTLEELIASQISTGRFTKILR